MTWASFAGRLAARPFRAVQCTARRACTAQPPAFSRRGCRAQSSGKDELGDLDQQLLQDLERLRQKQQQQQGAGASASGQQPGAGGAFSSSSSSSSSTAAPEAGGGGIKELVDKVLIADFFFILFALAWFGAGLVQQAATQNSALLDSWYSLWQWVFQPAIGVLMLGALSSGFVGWLNENAQKSGK